MTLDEAIDYLEDRAKDLQFRRYDREAQAQRLGIEALKRLEQNRTLHFIPSLKLLEGETKDRQEPQSTHSAAPHEPLTWGQAWAEELALLKK